MIFITEPDKTCIFAKNRYIIRFNNIPSFLDATLISNVIRDYIVKSNYSIDKLVYNFVTQKEMLEMNKKFLNHSTHTDIISFNYTDAESLKAEFFISLWAIERSAEEEKQSIENECVRVLIHGPLHCMGYNDTSPDKKKEMRILEDDFIRMFHVKQRQHV